nr:MAG TPA: hypothetical protein [Caudoviricetes sp.]
MLFRIQTDLQSVFYILAHSIVDVKRVDNHQHTRKRPIFEILCNSDPFEIDLDALRKSDGLLLHFDGEKYPNGWIFKDSCALVNNESEGGVHTSSMGDIYPIIPFRRGDSDYYQYGDYEIKAEYTSPHHLHEIRNLLRSGNIKAAENYFLAQFWKKVR